MPRASARVPSTRCASAGSAIAASASPSRSLPAASLARWGMLRMAISCCESSPNGAAGHATRPSVQSQALPLAVKCRIPADPEAAVPGQPPAPLTYRDAGVDIDAGNALVERIKPLAGRTSRPGVMGGLGGFGALFDLSGRYREPVLVSGTDGVGTKLRLAQQLGRHDTIGIDLVGMCVNDVLVQGAEPL